MGRRRAGGGDQTTYLETEPVRNLFQPEPRGVRAPRPTLRFAGPRVEVEKAHSDRSAGRCRPLVLFFDLVFILTLLRLGQALVDQLSWTGVLETLILLLAAFSIWTFTASVCDTFDPSRPVIELFIFGTMIGALVMAVAIPGAFGERGVLFAATYVALHIGRDLLLLVILRGHNAQAAVVQGLLWFGASAVPWIVGAFTRGPVRPALWAFAILLEYAIARLRFPVPRRGRIQPKDFPPAGEHLGERYRQLFTVALGEVFLAAGIAHGLGDFEAYSNVAFAVTFISTVLIWRIYIYRAGALLEAAVFRAYEPIRISRSVSRAHAIMVAGVLTVSVGGKLVISHPVEHTRPAWISVILGGPVLFLLGRVVLERAVGGRFHATRLVAVVVLAALAPVLLYLPPLVAASAAAAVLGGVTVTDTIRI
ncbi:low temperature requirement protein A [Plantactinospora sp. KLBMP9567]|uniref:low temperature requirement protein A n=1 Tax=Plantactinospora sp. KLBMP9567 TaxID=3085900 RepID=UPI00298231F6|nr:low temperature requirement protein A [Plantactinospora sp. KLBMP9567]MDW5324264.1 low temperature requirement protein A [Plantactinospora sp. KLBMP9567]